MLVASIFVSHASIERQCSDELPLDRHCELGGSWLTPTILMRWPSRGGPGLIKAKLKEQVAQSQQQERRVMDLEKSLELTSHAVEEKELEIERCKDREARMQSDAQDLKEKLAEAHEVLKSNQEVGRGSGR